ncbi:uncharacterized protein LOC129565383 [Sitodiplosis mosellana]|uniref:uncharacterized protein LOC129565383 n=1 Tax=Sitodiplosis mosellana TaxID=263140 RepID=UPI002444C45B|nr:uncharacterized protein LOC129565383 [Sitodiplosis mosellana]
MAQSFQENVRNDDSLMQLLSLVDNKAIGDNGEIRIGDFQGTCAKITTINTKNPREYTRRIAWTLTGRLLLGLTTYHDIQVRLCLEESRQLLGKCSGRLFDIEKVTKRKTKQVITKSKNKKARTVEVVEEEETENERVRFWEVPLVLDKNDITKYPDTTLVPASKVTLREIDEPTMPDFVGIDASLENGFGDDGFGVFEEEDEEMVAMDDAELNNTRSNDLVGIVPRHPSIDLDENMNNVDELDIDLESIGNRSEQAAGAPPPPEPSVRRKENPLNLLAKVTPLAPLAVTALRIGGGKRKRSIFKDEDKIISNRLMRKRTTNATIGCNVRRSNLMTQDKQAKLNKVDIFSLPIMNGFFIRELFARTAKMRVADTDWTTIKDGFNDSRFETGDQNQSNGSDGSSEIEILRNESESRIQTRSSSRLSRVSDSVPIQPALTSTPIRASQQSVNSFNAPRSQSDLFDPSPSFQDSALMPPPDFLNASRSRIVLNDQSIPHLNEKNVPEIDFNESPLVEHHDLATLLGENSLEYTIMQTLMKLWRKDNVHPIKVEHLLTPRCNRFQAAKTFSSLLSLKKKKLVQLENSADGRIAHISQGESLTSIAD